MAAALASRWLRASTTHIKPPISGVSIRTRTLPQPTSILLRASRPSPLARRIQFPHANSHVVPGRFFSSTPSRQALKTDPVDIAVAVPNLILDLFHTGLPWHMAIPAVVLFVRGVVLYHFFTLPTRKRQILSNNLSPLVAIRVQASTAQKLHERNKEYALQGRRASAKSTQLYVAGQRYLGSFLEHGKLAAKFGQKSVTQSAISRIAIEIGTWLTFVEALRLKCGAGEGLLAFLIRPVTSLVDAIRGPDAEALADRIDAATQSGRSLSESLSQQTIEKLSTYIDPSLKVEGFSWLQDLTIPDNTLVLPSLFALLMIAQRMLPPVMRKESLGNDEAKDEKRDNKTKNITKNETAQIGDRGPSTSYQQALELADQVRESSKPWSRWRPTDLIQYAVNGWIILAVFNLPAAVTLYILTNRIVSWLQRRWLDIKYPAPRPITPCRRPMRVKTKPENDVAW